MIYIFREVGLSIVLAFQNKMGNSVVNCSVFALLTLLLMCPYLPESEGLKFSSKTYVFLTTMGTDKGVIGKVQVETTSSDVVYSCRTKTSLLNIDKITGTLKLLIHLGHKAAVQFNNTRLVIQAESKSHKVTTIVIIVILSDFYGDLFAHEMENKVNSVVKSSHILGHGTVKITAAVLHRFLRKISGAAKPISMAQMKLEKVIEMIKGAIIKHFEALFGKDAVVSAYLHIKGLLSAKMINQIESKVSCKEPTVVNRYTCPRRSVFRTIDGTCNNLLKPNLGASDRAFIRLLPAKYFDADGLNDPIGYPDQPNAPTVPSPFEVSRDFIKDEVASSSSPTLTHAVMQFGQFLDHDLDLAVDSEGSTQCRNVSCTGSRSDFECPCYPILPLPGGDTTCIRVIRSAAVCQEKKGYPTTREQINVNTAFVDASQIYGSTEERAKELRETKPDDQGLLRSLNVNVGELLPLDRNFTGGADQLCQDVGGCFIAGDARSNEQQSLASFHSLFLREHNRIARKLKSINGHWNGERVYQETRKILGAIFQKITYYDYLPLILGPNPLPRYTGYKPLTNPGISNAFATAAYRFGHSTIRPEFDLLNKNFDPIAPAVNLRFMFFNNTVIQRRGIEPFLFGLVGNMSEKVDRTLSPGIVRHLFERKNSPGQNLAALNIQRSRDHGLPGYNKFRKFCGMSNAETFEDTKNEITDPENREILKRLYNNDPNLTELWVAGLAEAPSTGASVGPSFRCIIANQFRRTRDGDRFYYKRRGIFTPEKRKEIDKSSLSRIYCDNLKNLVSIQENAFKAPTNRNQRISCERIPGVDLCQWKDDKYFKQPCLHGGSPITRGKGTKAECRCKCKIKPWGGSRCERKPAIRSVPWHATIIGGKNGVKCSGALVSKWYVLTTRSCVQGLIGKLGWVRLGDYRSHRADFGEITIRIRSVRFPTKWFSKTHDIALVRLRKPVKPNSRVSPIRIRPVLKKTSYLTAWGGGRILQILQLTVACQRDCKTIFKPFSFLKNFCTLKASFPVVPSKLSGSPLIQYHGSRPYLKGLLTDIEKVHQITDPRFASYIRPSKFTLWLKRYLK